MNAVVKQKQERTDPVKNGVCKTNTGHRCVLTSKDLEVRPVLFVVESGYEPDRGTYQVGPEKGDLKFVCSWNKHGDGFHIEEWTGTDWTTIQDINVYGALWRKLEAKYPWTKTFLSVTDRASSFIPYSETIAQKAKRKRLERFFNYWEIPNVEIDEYLSSPKGGLNLEAVPAPEGLLDHIPTSIINKEAGNNIETYERWYEVVRIRAGKVSRREARPLDIEYGDGQMDADGTIRQESQPLNKLVNSSAIYLIKVVIGAYRKEKRTHSRTVDIYQLSNKGGTNAAS